jgi:hypothetical protein
MENAKDETELIDVEEYFKAGKPIPHGRRYLIKVDTKKIELRKQIVTGREILEAAGKKPERFQLNQKLRGGMVKKIGLEDRVDLAEPGIERFMTIPLDQTEGTL